MHFDRRTIVKTSVEHNRPPGFAVTIPSLPINASSMATATRLLERLSPYKFTMNDLHDLQTLSSDSARR